MTGYAHPHLTRIDRAIDALIAERRRLIEEAPIVAYQGAPGAFSEDAALALTGSVARLDPRDTLESVFDALVTGAADLAVVPVENTIAGAVPRCAELIRRHGARTIGEHAMRIVHALVGCDGARLEDVRRAASHPVALAQCARFFETHPWIAACDAFDTAGAVAAVVKAGDRASAAIASARAAAVYGGVVLADGIQDRADNFTRFVLLAAR